MLTRPTSSPLMDTSCTTPWESKTQSNAQELEFQTTLIRDRFQRHQNSSLTEILSELAKLTKGAAKMMHRCVLMADQVASLQRANDAATKRKSYKRKYIKDQGALLVREGAILAASKDVEGETLSDVASSGGQSAERQAKQRRCGNCGKAGHNVRTCQEDVEMSSESDTSSYRLIE